MERLFKWGAYAALVQALLYIGAFVILATFQPSDAGSWSAVQKLSYTLTHSNITLFWALLYYVSGIVLVVLTAALHARLSTQSPALMAITTPFGYIWAGFLMASGMVSQLGFAAVARLHAESADQALTVWEMVKAVQNALGGGVELLGGIWVLLLSIALIRDTKPHRALSILGVIVGTAGVLTIVPALSFFKEVFGVTQILWFIWIGIWFLRRH